MKRSRWQGAKALLGLGAGAALALAVAGAGCGSYPLDHQTGGSKGPEIRVTATTQQPRSVSASQMSQSGPPAPNLGAKTTPAGAGTDGGATAAPVVVSAQCAEGGACSGVAACVGLCDPGTMTVTSCATCDNMTFTDCTQNPCAP